MSENDKQSQDAQEENTAEESQDSLEDSEQQSGILGRFTSARRAFESSFERVTGAEFRRQFEEFSNVVSTAILGVHRDQSDLRDRLDSMESSQGEKSSAFSAIGKWTLAVSLLALVIGLIALLRSF